MVQEIRDIQRGTWYKSDEFHPPKGEKVLCCFAGPNIFWLDYVHYFGDRAGLRWVSEDVEVDKTKNNRNPFCWQIPILPDFENY
jgi:hypothetical protein